MVLISVFVLRMAPRVLDLAAFDGQVAYLECLIDLGADVDPINAKNLPLTDAALG